MSAFDDPELERFRQEVNCAALVHVWTAPRMQEKNEKADGQVDCDHVSGLVDAAQ